MTPDSTDTVLFETSPFGTIDAIVEQDGRVVYFYLNERPDSNGQTSGNFGTRACWVRNLQKGPMVIDQSDMAKGSAPLMPRNDCIDGSLHSVPQEEALAIIWFEEGNGAALVELDGEKKSHEVIAVIPPWSGIEGFHGYAANCAHETQLAWPMPKQESLYLRIDRAAEFWESFSSPQPPFSRLQPELLACFNSQFGKEDQYYSIDGGKFPPRGLVRYETKDETVLITVGMSLCSMPGVEFSFENPMLHRRIELGTKVPYEEGRADAELVQATMRSLGSWAAYPWNSLMWLGEGHTIDWLSGSEKAALHRDDSIKLPEFRGDPINLFWISPQD